MPRSAIIPDRAEFIDALELLRRGHVLVKTDDEGRCALNGCIVYASYEPLAQYGLIDEFDNPQGRCQLHYYRLTPRGREFAERAVAEWRRRPLWQRLAVRLTG